jgi:hypothetical protein
VIKEETTGGVEETEKERSMKKLDGKKNVQKGINNE